MRGCGLLGTRKIEVPLCAGLEGGALRVARRGQTLHAGWVAPSLGLGVGWRGEHLGVWSLVEGALAAYGSRILLGDEVLWETGVLSARLLSGIEVYFSIERR